MTDRSEFLISVLNIHDNTIIYNKYIQYNWKFKRPRNGLHFFIRIYSIDVSNGLTNAAIEKVKIHQVACGKGQITFFKPLDE